MKKNDLFKAIGICFLIFVLLSWVIPTGSYATGEYVKANISAVGLIDLLYYPIVTFGTFIQYGVLFLVLGGFYGVMNKTGVYKNMVDTITAKFEGKEKLFLILTISLLALLSALIGLPVVLFTLVPLLVAIIMSLGYDKMVAFASTIGAILVGSIGSLYNVNNAHINNLLSLGKHDNLVSKLVLLAVLVFLLVMFVLKKSSNLELSKKEKKQAILEIPLLETNEKSKKSFAPLAVILTFLSVLLFVSMYSWNYNLGIAFFDEVYESLMAVTIGDFAIFKNLIGDISPFGYWDTYEMCVILIAFSLLIGWIYSIKLSDTVSAFVEGSKKMVKVAFYAILANVVFSLMLVSTDTSILNTINNGLLSLAKEFNIGVATLLPLVGSFFFNNFYYLSNITLQPVTTVYTDASMYGVLGILFQSLHSLMMLILPTSYILIAGLSMLDISFKDWFKYIWKYIIQAFIIILIVAIIVFMVI